MNILNNRKFSVLRVGLTVGGCVFTAWVLSCAYMIWDEHKYELRRAERQLVWEQERIVEYARLSKKSEDLIELIKGTSLISHFRVAENSEKRLVFEADGKETKRIVRIVFNGDEPPEISSVTNLQRKADLRK